MHKIDPTNAPGEQQRPQLKALYLKALLHLSRDNIIKDDEAYIALDGSAFIVTVALMQHVLMMPLNEKLPTTHIGLGSLSPTPVFCVQEKPL